MPYGGQSSVFLVKIGHLNKIPKNEKIDRFLRNTGELRSGVRILCMKNFMHINIGLCYRSDDSNVEEVIF